MTKEEQAGELLEKYLNKELSPSGIRKVEEWYASYERNGALINDETKAVMEKQMFGQLQKVMHEKAKSKTLQFFQTQQWLKIAAILLFTSGLALTLWSTSSKEDHTEHLFSVTTSAAENKKITLTDGSEIWLSPSSKLLYPEKFNSLNRVVELTEGEAFFKIAHEEQRNFTVKTADHLETKVLGTSFRIKSYRAKRYIDILVATGKVSVGNTNQIFGTLIKGQQICYDKKERHAKISYTPNPVQTELVFEGTSLEEVVRQLGYVYSIQITLSNAALYSLKCSAKFKTNQKPAEILDLLCSLHHLQFSESKNHKTFNIYER